MRIAAVGDLHCRADTRRNVAVALRGVDQEADVLLLAGDLTDHGTRGEANWLPEEASAGQMGEGAGVGKPDYESGQREEGKAAPRASAGHRHHRAPPPINRPGLARAQGD